MRVGKLCITRNEDVGKICIQERVDTDKLCIRGDDTGKLCVTIFPSLLPPDIIYRADTHRLTADETTFKADYQR